MNQSVGFLARDHVRETIIYRTQIANSSGAEGVSYIYNMMLHCQLSNSIYQAVGNSQPNILTELRCVLLRWEARYCISDNG